MSLLDTQLNSREKQIYSFCKSVAFADAKTVSEALGMNYYTALRYLNALSTKGYLNCRKDGNSLQFTIPRVGKTTQSMTIPFKGYHYTLEELLLYLSETDDYQKYGKVIAGACYHLAYRVAQLQAGEIPDSPGPKEVSEFLNHAKVRYQELLNLVNLLQALPLYDDNETTLAAFGEINERYLHEMVFNVFQPTWQKGAIGKHGMKDKFRDSLSGIKNKFLEKYGASRKVIE